MNQTDDPTETPWRKKPGYQGGFLLDGGIHYVAAARILLGESGKLTAISAYTTQLQEYLPPVDTINSIWQTKSGVSGIFCASFGTTLTGSEYTVACERGTVSVDRSKVTVREGEGKEKQVTEKEFPEEGNGVKYEVAAWAASIVAGKANPKQSPEEALADLEILEGMLKSGEAHGKSQILQYQI